MITDDTLKEGVESESITLLPDITTQNDEIDKAMETTTTNIDFSSSKSKKTLDDEHFTEKCRSSVKVVISAFVGILMGFGVGVIFMFFKQSIQRNKRQDPTIAETNASFEIQGETVNAYEEIDDITFVSHDASIYQNEENSDTSSNSINTEQRSENNNNTIYLNPYQPIIPTTKHHLYMITVTSEDSSNTVQLDAVHSPSFCDDDKTDDSGKSDSGSRISRQLNYVELDMNATMSEDNKVSAKYVNTRIYANQATENKASTQKTQYAEIVHTV
ncbi:uncharacterized protein LOC127706877 [Mytilus californianus]|uniref:uncharacterized protein LOC127706877 n=1 Tax=Mytilus californianus TaxID=6549 RepID=UPI002247AAE6|nr:uncharacterized protein LOC127706877 [Mytilus californianus]